MKYTKEEIEKWYSLSQYIAGLVCDVFKPKEIQIIQDFLETGKGDALKKINNEPSTLT